MDEICFSNLKPHTSLVCGSDLFLHYQTTHTSGLWMRSVSPLSNHTHVWFVDEICFSTIKPQTHLVFQPHTTGLVCWLGLFLQSPISSLSLQSPTPHKSRAWTREISLSTLPPRTQALRADEICLPNLQPHTSLERGRGRSVSPVSHLIHRYCVRMRSVSPISNPTHRQCSVRTGSLSRPQPVF